MDPNVIHEKSVRKWTNRTENNIFMSLQGQHNRTFILFLYNFEWVLWLFESLQQANKYIYLTFIVSICMYQLFPLDPTYDLNRSVPSYCVGLLEEATRIISKSRTHHAKGMVSVPQKTHRCHVNTVWSLFQTWQTSTNTYRTSTFISLNTMNIS